jgi:dihydrofolate synthase/folylpolyglutamate synthase
MKSLVQQLENTAYKQLHFIFGTVGDKDPAKVLALLPKQANYYFVKADIARAMDAEELAARAKEFGLSGQVYPSVSEAYKNAQLVADDTDMIFVGGSTFVVAEVL